jgi:hypothetical protein
MQLSVCVFGRAAYTVEVDGEVEVVRWDYPAILALGVLCGPMKETFMRNSFLDAGGVAAIVHLLGESTCSVTIAHITILIDTLLLSTLTRPSRESPIMSPPIAERFLNEGEEGHVMFHSSQHERYSDLVIGRIREI